MKYALLSENGEGQVIKTIIAGETWRNVIDQIMEICEERFTDVTGYTLCEVPDDLEDSGYDSEEEYFEDYEPYEWIDDLFYADYADYSKLIDKKTEVTAETVDQYSFGIEDVDFSVECVGQDIRDFVHNFNEIEYNPWVLQGYCLPESLEEDAEVLDALNNDLYKICFGNPSEDELGIFCYKN